jgi:hypothetical protein
MFTLESVVRRHGKRLPTPLFAAFLLACFPPVATAEQPMSWFRNGGLEQPAGWYVQNGSLADGGQPGKCLRFEGPGGASQEVLVAGREHTFTAAVDVQVAGVAAEPGKSGCAFAAVYQLDEDGQIVAFRDFVQALGTQAWQRHSFTFRVDPRTAHVSLRCGLHQAGGIACFDNWTLVFGNKPMRLDEVREISHRPARPGSAAILSQPDLPVRGKPSSPQALAKNLQGAGYETQLLGADEISDPFALNASRYDLLVVPTGQAFPAEARLATVDFLRKGGNLLTTGGYAFQHLVRKVGDRWLSEEELARLRLQEALQKQSLLPDGGFEKVREMPIGGFATDGQWRRASNRCAVVEEDPKEGRFVAKVDLPPGVPDTGAHAWLDLPAGPGKTYRISGWMRTRDVTGAGIAFIAIYQHDAAGKLVEHRDFASTRGTTPWQFYTHVFTPKPQVARLHVFFGFYLAHGTAWFDDIRLVETTGVQFRPMNTSTGKPGDGLAVAPTQIGIFDASFPLKRARTMRTAADQHILLEEIQYRALPANTSPKRERGNDASRTPRPRTSSDVPSLALRASVGDSGDELLRGWAASGLVGYDNARWVPLLETYDRFGRPRGAAGAMLMHYNGPFAGSFWAYFGLENSDLWANTDGPAARRLQQIARFMLRKTFLHNLTTDHRLYRKGEAVRAAVVVDNRGTTEFRGAVRFELLAPDVRQASRLPLGNSGASETLALRPVVHNVVVGPGATQRVEAVLEKLDTGPDLCRLAATLMADGQPIDVVHSGVVHEQPGVVQSGPQLRFRDNYFTLNGRATFLFGSDTYAMVYKAACENPWTWHQELTAARDVGMNLCENLQYQNAGHRMNDDDWRAFGAMAQLAQRSGLVFMPGILIGHNVAIGDAALGEESRLCRGYASHLGATPGLLWYINGDYQLDAAARPAEVKTLWNRWLKTEHGTTERLRSLWGAAAVQGELGNLEYPPPNSGRWDDAAAVDRMRFLVWLMRRWNEAHVAAVRQHDREHPITSEYYQFPFGGMDLVMSIDGQDVSNIGYFDRPGADLDGLPLKIRWNDLRLRGKGVSLGEYGVKTHPAWSEANGGEGYHIMRTEEEQIQLFLAVAHYGLGLGACKIQNWCLRDDPTWVFPWGIFYPNHLVPKDVAYAHRNQSMIWRFFRPVFRPEGLAVCLANQLRLGNDDGLGTRVGYQAFADLLALHYPFNVIDDDHLDKLQPEIKTMILPCPLSMSDEAFAKLVAWVKAGGTLLVTGDFTHDPYRRRTRTDRLKQLAGVEFVAASGQAGSRNSAKEVQVNFLGLDIRPFTLRPCLHVKPLTAEVLGKASDGEPVLVRHGLGSGAVYFLADPIEMADEEPTVAARRQLYSAVLRAAAGSQPAKLKPLSVAPDEPWLHVMNQPTARGTVHVIYNKRPGPGTAAARIATAAGPVTLTTRNRWPALAAVTNKGAVVAVNAYGKVAVGGEPLVDGVGLKALLSLDGSDLRTARAILLAPFEPGRVELPRQTGPERLAVIGEFREGRWGTFEHIALNSARPTLEIDADRATCLILVCPAGQSQHWIDRLNQAVLRPDQIDGY